jgi:hypothetical protein
VNVGLLLLLNVLWSYRFFAGSSNAKNVNHVALDEKQGFVFPAWIHKKQEVAELFRKVPIFVGQATS